MSTDGNEGVQDSNNNNIATNTTHTPPVLPDFSQKITSLKWKMLALTTIALVAWFDFLFWDGAAGITIALAVIPLVISILSHRPNMMWTRFRALSAILLFGATIQSIIEFTFLNFLMLSLLILTLAGDTFYENITPAWIRTYKMLLALVKSPARWFWFFEGATIESPKIKNKHDLNWILSVILPALLIAPFFIFFLSLGNAVFRLWMSTAFENFVNIFSNFDLSFWRVLLWIILATLLLALLHPSKAKQPTAKPSPPPIDQDNFTLNALRTGSILVLLNAIFFIANTADILFLWVDVTLPAGVSYKEFVHDGVTSLTLAVFLSAAVMAWRFKGENHKHILLRVLASVWIAQNLFLLGGVVLRIYRYVDTSHLTVVRIWLAAWIVLVVCGYIFLTFKIWIKRSTGWLIKQCFISTFILLYAMQFPDLAGIVSNFNTHRWIKDSTRLLDLEYMKELGTNAWPALNEIANSDREISPQAAEFLQHEKRIEKERQQNEGWRGWQWRREIKSESLN